jgi:hypothetical protein
MAEPNTQVDQQSTNVQPQQTGQPANQPAAEPKAETLLAGKFKSAAELEKGYVELQKKLGAKTTAEPVPVIPAAPKVELPEEITLDNYQDVLKKAGLSPDSVIGEWQRDKKLSPASIEALEKAGIPKIAASALAIGLSTAIEGQQRQIASVVNEAAGEVFGSRDAYVKAANDASTLLNDDERKALNNLITNPATAKVGLQALKATLSMRSGADTGKTLKTAGQPTTSVTAVNITSIKDAEAIKQRAKNGDAEALRMVGSKEYRDAIASLSRLTG